MKKTLILIFSLVALTTLKAQEKKDKNTTKKETVKTYSSDFPKKKSNANPADHFLIQFGSDSWTNRTDSVRTNGGKHFNFYLFTDKPFKTNPKFSVAYGLGIGSSNIYFDKTYVNLKANANKLPFSDQSNSNHFSKFKVTEIFLELPVELRYSTNPEEPSKAWKFAVGAKVGTLLKAYSKGKDLQDKNGNTVYGPTYIEKEYSKKFFNTTRLSVTGRIGYGNISLSAGYTLTPVLKSGFGAEMNTLSVGLTISGL